MGVSCSAFLKHLTDTKALIKRSKHTGWYTEVQLRVHIAYNRKTLSAPVVTGFPTHRWYFSSFFSKQFPNGNAGYSKVSKCNAITQGFALLVSL